MYARVENNQVVGVMFNLPTTYANVSGFNNLPTANLLTYGYYPLEEVKPDLSEIDIGTVESPNKIATQYYGTTTDVVQANKVVRTYSVQSKPTEVLNAEVADIFTKVLETHYDSKAKERRYDNRFTCALRAGYVSAFQPEGVAFAQWMDACNAYAYGVMAEVVAQTRPMPTITQLLSELPVLTWP
jgi:hypothetical protein